MRFLNFAYLSKRWLVPGTSATSGNFMSTSTVLIFYILCLWLPCPPPWQAAAAQCPAVRHGHQHLRKELLITKKWRIRLFWSSLSLKLLPAAASAGKSRGLHLNLGAVVWQDGVGSVLCMRSFGYCEGKEAHAALSFELSSGQKSDGKKKEIITVWLLFPSLELLQGPAVVLPIPTRPWDRAQTSPTCQCWQMPSDPFAAPAPLSALLS